MNSFWDDRFVKREYAYGKDPNVFFKSSLSNIEPGKLLLPGEGEGRNAVWAANRGWQVFAWDGSMEAKKKAMKLAEEFNVKIKYDVIAANDWQATPDTYDAIGLVFLHLLPQERIQLHAALAASLRPGGKIILEAFSKEQIQLRSGGPKNISILYDVEEMEEDFKDLKIISLDKKVIHLSEGNCHKGEASVIRLLAEKE